MSLKTVRNLLFLFSFLILSFGLGYQFGIKGSNRQQFFPSFITGKAPKKEVTLDFSLFWDVWDRLNRNYIDKKMLNSQKMIYGAISGMVSSLEDPYTVFLSPDQNKEAKDDLSGRFEGIGAQLGIKDKKIIVVAPLKGAPAEKAGLHTEDWIMKVDGKDTTNWTLPQAVSKIRGPKGTRVALTIMHKEASGSSEVSVVRDEIKVASVEWEIKNIKYSRLSGINDAVTPIKSGTASGQIANSKYQIVKEPCNDCERIVYLKLSRFGDQTADEWNKAIEEVKKASERPAIKGLVFDLRNNPGGYLTGAVFIASEFLADGTVVIQEHSSGQRQTFTVNRKGRLLNMPMVVLINKGSASASEIVAGALQELNRAKVVGEKSFGKGSIQEAQELTDEAGLHITTAKWLLPKGDWINGEGITPDVKVENDEKKPEEDLQLIKAIEALL